MANERVPDSHFSGHKRLTRAQSEKDRHLAAVINADRKSKHVVTAGEDTAGTLDIVTGLTGIDSLQLTIKSVTTNILKMGDQVITDSAGTITVADGSVSKVVEGDTIYWSAYKAIPS